MTDRERIRALLDDRPGLTVSEVATKLKLPRSTVRELLGVAHLTREPKGAR